MDSSVRQIIDPGWEPWGPADVARRLVGANVPWAVAGGWSLDLFLGRVTRAHEDIEIAVPAAGFAAVRTALASMHFEVISDGMAHPLDSPAFGEAHQTWVSEPTTGVYRLDIFREPHDGEVWICRRDPKIRLPYSEVVCRTADGIPYQAPQIGLLFKAKHSRTKDDADLAGVLPMLDLRQRRWLTDALTQVHPGHRWLEKVKDTTATT
jgi:hypothetical protein